MQQVLRNNFKFFKKLTLSRVATFARWHTSTSSAVVSPFQAAPSTFRLRDYQDECIQSVLSYLEKGHKRLGISLATGSGKTVIFTQLIDRVQPPRYDATQSLILAHRRELVEQAARHCTDAYPSKSIEVEMGNIHASGTADITVASISSITSGERMKKFNPEKFKLVLVDEAHHIVAASYMDTLEYFGIVRNTGTANHPALVGVSATLSRFDGLRLSDAIDHIVYHKDYIDMIGENWLSSVIFTTVQLKADLSKVRLKGARGDFQVGSLSKAVNTRENNNLTVQAWLARASGRKSTLVFCVDLAHVADLTATFREHGIDAQYITGDTAKPARSKKLDAFKAMEYPVLLNCGIFTEGTDIPNIDCVLLARPTKSRNLLVQMIGRGMRLCLGKTDCHVIDMVASLEAGVVTTPTLFGLDPAVLVKEASVDKLSSLREKQEKRERQQTEALREERQEASPNLAAPASGQATRKIVFTDYDSVFDLIDDTSGERHIRSISALSWVDVGRNRFVLTALDGEYITIELAEGSSTQYRVFHTRKIEEPGPKTRSPFMRPRQIAKSSTFSDAVHAADTFATEKYPWPLIARAQRWRNLPATDGQLAIINKIRDMDHQLTPKDVSKGRANEMITKIKFGARSRFNQLEAARRKEVKASSLETYMQQREQVRVGPMPL